MTQPVDYEELVRIGRRLLIAIGEDPEREGLKGTPVRFAKVWKEFIEYDPGNVETTFESVRVDQLVVVKGMRVWSMCEHHMIPFWCDISIGYLTGNRVLGLSKFARIAREVAHNLQIQERMVQQIADRVVQLTGSGNVGVLGSGVHLCMVMRGVRTFGEMVSSDMRGHFRDEPDLRQEFLSLIQK